jgi:hypothetical protein
MPVDLITRLLDLGVLGVLALLVDTWICTRV